MSETETIEFGLIPMEIWKREKPIEIFRKMVTRELPAPPIGESFEFLLSEIEPGRAVFEGKPHPKFYNPLGTIHGGFICTLLDSAMACAIHSTLDAGKGSTSVEIKVNFVRPIFEKTGNLKAVGEIVTADKSLRQKADFWTKTANFTRTGRRLVLFSIYKRLERKRDACAPVK